MLKLKNINSKANIFCSIHGKNSVIYGLPIKANNIRQLINKAFQCSSSKTMKKISDDVAKISIRSINLN